MSNIDDLNKALKILEEKHQQIQKYIITKPLEPGKNPPPIDDISQMGKAFKEYYEALEDYRKIREQILKEIK